MVFAMRIASSKGWEPFLTRVVSPALEERHQLENPKDNQTKPKIHKSTQINSEPLMAGGSREIGIKSKIEAIAEKYNHQPTDPS